MPAELYSEPAQVLDQTVIFGFTISLKPWLGDEKPKGKFIIIYAGGFSAEVNKK
jgi:hypothetical protein